MLIANFHGSGAAGIHYKIVGSNGFPRREARDDGADEKAGQ